MSGVVFAFNPPHSGSGVETARPNPYPETLPKVILADALNLLLISLLREDYQSISTSGIQTRQGIWNFGRTPGFLTSLMVRQK